MAVPKRRRSSSASRQRRMHIFINPVVLAVCQKCARPVRPHTVCKHCGYYKGKEFVNVLASLSKKEKKAREKDIKEVEKQKKQESPLAMEEISRK